MLTTCDYDNMHAHDYHRYKLLYAYCLVGSCPSLHLLLLYTKITSYYLYLATCIYPYKYVRASIHILMNLYLHVSI